MHRSKTERRSVGGGIGVTGNSTLLGIPSRNSSALTSSTTTSTSSLQSANNNNNNNNNNNTNRNTQPPPTTTSSAFSSSASATANTAASHRRSLSHNAVTSSRAASSSTPSKRLSTSRKPPQPVSPLNDIPRRSNTLDASVLALKTPLSSRRTDSTTITTNNKRPTVSPVQLTPKVQSDRSPTRSTAASSSRKSATPAVSTSTPSVPTTRQRVSPRSSPPTLKPSHKRTHSANIVPNRSASSQSAPISATPSAPKSPATSTLVPSPSVTGNTLEISSSQGAPPSKRPRAPARSSSNHIAAAGAAAPPPPTLASRNGPSPTPAAPPPPAVEIEIEQPTPTSDINMDYDTRYRQEPRLSRNGRYAQQLEDDDPTIRMDRGGGGSESHGGVMLGTPDRVNNDRSDSTTPNEDLFLNLARSQTPKSQQAANDAATRSERRKSRLMQYGNYRSPASQDAYSPSPTRHAVPLQSTSAANVESWANNDSSPGNIYASLNDEDDNHSLSHSSSFLRKQRGLDSSSNHSRSVSEVPTRTATAIPRANTLNNGYSGIGRAQDRSIGSMIENDRLAAATAIKTTARSGVSVNNDDAGSVSTTAASTVWDELDDLKSRIKRLEFSGKLPPNPGSGVGAAASGMSNTSSGDTRPRTGTTTVTTVSSSPRHPQQASSKTNGASSNLSPENTMHGTPPTSPNTHPLLHSALAKGRSVLPEEITKALEAVAVDALSLAQFVGSTGNPATSGISSSNNDRTMVTDRQVRRKVDSMCRSLTELCIALSDGRMPLESPEAEEPPTLQPQFQPSNVRPVSRGGINQDPIDRVPTSMDFRSPSAIGHRIDREATATPNSANRHFGISRFDARRTSIMSNNSSNNPSPAALRAAEAMANRADASPSPAPGQRGSNLQNRNSMSFRYKDAQAAQAAFQQEFLQDDLVDPSFRSPSRAAGLDIPSSSLRSGLSPRVPDFQSSGSYNNSMNNSYMASPRLTHSRLPSQLPQQQPQPPQQQQQQPHRRAFSTASQPVSQIASVYGGQQPSLLSSRLRNAQQQQDPNVTSRGISLDQQRRGVGLGQQQQQQHQGLSYEDQQQILYQQQQEQDMLQNQSYNNGITGGMGTGRMRTTSISGGGRIPGGSVRRSGLLGSNVGVGSGGAGLGGVPGGGGYRR